MTEIFIEGDHIKRFISFDVESEMGYVDFKDFTKDIDTYLSPDVKHLFELIETKWGFKRLEKQFFEYLEFRTELTADDVRQIMYLFTHDIMETFNEATPYLKQFNSNFENSLRIFPHITDYDLDLIKRFLIGDTLTPEEPISIIRRKKLQPITKEEVEKKIGYSYIVEEFDESKIKWIFFYALHTKHSLFLVTDGNTKKVGTVLSSPHITQDHMYVTANLINITMVFEILLSLEQDVYWEWAFKLYKAIRQKQYELGASYSQFLNDIFASKDLDGFMNSEISAKIKDWLPAYNEISARTDNHDMEYWKQRLWTHRKIETNTDDDVTVRVKVTKKIKYERDWKTDQES